MTEQMPNRDIAETLGIDGSGTHRRRWSKWLFWVALPLAIIVLFMLWQSRDATPEMQYKTQESRQGSLAVTVSATGNLEPTNQVDVGSELSGIIDSVMVDYNDRVHAGQALAVLDTDTLQAQVLQSEAALAAAEARVKESQATVLETKFKLQRCQRMAEKQLSCLPLAELWASFWP